MAETDHSSQDRTEQATPKRIQDARKKGQAPRSRELNTLVSLFASGFAFLAFGDEMIGGLSNIIASNLSFGHDLAFSNQAFAIRLTQVLYQSLAVLGPIFIVLFALALVSPLALGGWVFSTELLMPKFERIDPAKGLARIFSTRGLVELAKSLAKFILVGGTVWLVISSVFSDITSLSQLPFSQSLQEAGKLFIWCFLGFSSVLILVAAIDVPFQLWDYKKQLMMTKQEIRDEMKESDGRPEVKSVMRDKQQQMAQQRMMSAVPNADVVITNPTHFAVALKYEQEGSGAPIVVAKGKNLIAAKIREVAEANSVAIFSAPPLARALYSSTDINQQIPENLFLAVAQVLAYIFQLRKAAVQPGVRVVKPVNLPIPDEYDDGGPR